MSVFLWILFSGSLKESSAKLSFVRRVALKSFRLPETVLFISFIIDFMRKIVRNNRYLWHNERYFRPL